MSENLFIDENEPEQAPEPVEAAVEAPVVEEPETAPAEPDVFSRDYVEGLRRENAQWRTQLRTYEEKLDGYTADEKAALLDYIYLTRRAESGDEEAAAQLAELMGETEEEEPVTQFDEATFRQLAREEAARLVEEQQAEQARIQGIQGVQSKAEELGYVVGSDDYILLLKYANEVESDDPLAAGHEKVQAYKKAIIDQHLKAIQAQNEQVGTQPVASGAAPSNIKTPTDFRAAREAFHERLSRT